MIQLAITRTEKSPGRKCWTRLPERTLNFIDTAEAAQYLRRTYGKQRRTPIYQDRKDGSTFQAGYCFHSTVTDLDDKNYYVQEWVDISEVTYTPVNLRAFWQAATKKGSSQCAAA